MVTLKENLPNSSVTKLPDGPKTPRFIKTILGIIRPVERLEKNAQTYGDIFSSQFSGFPPIIVISNPRAIQEIFTADPKLFDSGKGNKILQPLVGEYSLLLMDGDRHLHQRRLLMPPFHGERMRAYGDLISDIASGAMRNSRQGSEQLAVGKTFKARTLMQEISMRVILRAVFGLDEGERLGQLRKLLSELLDFFNLPLNSSFLFIKALQKDLGPWSPWGRFLRKKQQIDSLLYAEIRARRSLDNSSREDILSLLMSAVDEDGNPMTDAELHDELITLLFAGHETTATSLAWALYWIHRLPEVKENLLKELDSSGGDSNEISRLPYLNAVCSETLRIYPVALFTFPRIVKSPVQIMGYEFAPGTILQPCIYLTHHRPDIYPEPKSFKPERFLERQFSPYEYLPFGGGNRRCIGMAFALFEMKLVLATVLSRWQLTLVDNRPVKPVRRGITMAPEGGVRMVVTGER